VKFISKKTAFTLAEICVAASILLALLSVSLISGTSAAGKLADGRADFHVAAEVDMTARWLEGVIARSLLLKRDFTLVVGNFIPSSRLKVKWKDTSETEERAADGISFRAPVANFQYSSRFQTFTPAIGMMVYYGEGKFDETDWSISVSGYGLVRAYRRP